MSTPRDTGVGEWAREPERSSMAVLRLMVFL